MVAQLPNAEALVDLRDANGNFPWDALSVSPCGQFVIVVEGDGMHERMDLFDGPREQRR